jgi:hypothetical protein
LDIDKDLSMSGDGSSRDFEKGQQFVHLRLQGFVVLVDVTSGVARPARRCNGADRQKWPGNITIGSQEPQKPGQASSSEAAPLTAAPMPISGDPR